MRSKYKSLTAARKTSRSKKTVPRSPSRQPAQKLPDEFDWRRNGNGARLPKPPRDKVNSMILDGLPYPAIIQSLGHSGKHLNCINLTRWRKGGYKDWLQIENEDPAISDSVRHSPQPSPSQTSGYAHVSRLTHHVSRFLNGKSQI